MRILCVFVIIIMLFTGCKNTDIDFNEEKNDEISIEKNTVTGSGTVKYAPLVNSEYYFTQDNSDEICVHKIISDETNIINVKNLWLIFADDDYLYLEKIQKKKIKFYCMNILNGTGQNIDCEYMYEIPRDDDQISEPPGIGDVITDGNNIITISVEMQKIYEYNIKTDKLNIIMENFASDEPIGSHMFKYGTYDNQGAVIYSGGYRFSRGTRFWYINYQEGSAKEIKYYKKHGRNNVKYYLDNKSNSVVLYDSSDENNLFIYFIKDNYLEEFDYESFCYYNYQNEFEIAEIIRSDGDLYLLTKSNNDELCLIKVELSELKEGSLISLTEVSDKIGFDNYSGIVVDNMYIVYDPIEKKTVDAIDLNSGENTKIINSDFYMCVIE